MSGAATSNLVSGNSLEDLNLPQYRWKNRMVVTVASSLDHPKLQSVLDQIEANRCEFDNRHLLHLHVADNEVDFRLMLIGKDGGVKMEGQDLTLQDMFNRIDTMPMRRREMR